MRRLALAVTALALVAVPACSGDDDTSATQFTPAPTDVDPGPNDTSNAPQTVQGTVRLDPATGCIALETETVRYALAFTDYAMTDDDGRPALEATVDGRVLAHDGDTLVVSGLPATDAPATDCGAPFTVDSLNSVLPPQ
jgi:hypothetical protein